MLKYKLRTLLIVLALGPPVLAWGFKHAPDELAFWRKDKPIPEVTWKQAAGGDYQGTILTLPTFKFPITEQELQEAEKLLAKVEAQAASERPEKPATPDRP